MTGRSGRRPGESGTRAAILDAARQSFAGRGYDATTIRAVAREAAVDPALVHHYFGSKDALLAAAMELPIDPAAALPQLLGPGVEGIGERLVRFFFGLWESPVTRPALLAIVRSAVRHEPAAALLRGFVGRELIGPIAAGIEAPDPQLRASLAGSQLIGLAMTRYVIRLEPIASADLETVIAAVAPAVQRYLTWPLEDLIHRV